MCFFLCRSWYSNLPIVGETWAGSPLEEGLVAPFLTSHPSPCTSRSVFYLPGHHLLLPSICLLVQLPPLFLYLSVLYTLTYHAPCASPVVPSIYLVLPPTLSVCILCHRHLLPCRPILPLALSAQPLAAYSVHQSALEQRCSGVWSIIGKSASAGDPRLWVA